MKSQTHYIATNMDYNTANLLIRNIINSVNTLLTKQQINRYGGQYYMVMDAFKIGYETHIDVYNFDNRLLPQKRIKNTYVSVFGNNTMPKTIIKVHIPWAFISIASSYSLYNRILNAIIVGVSTKN